MRKSCHAAPMDVRRIVESLAAFIVFCSLAHADESRTSMGITGCSPVAGSVAATVDGRIVFAGCEGPKGIFYSRDEGLTWTFAGVKDSAYEEGRGTLIFLTDTAAYTLSGPRMVKTNLPVPGDSGWVPGWQFVQPSQNDFSRPDDFVPAAMSGRYLVGTSGPIDNKFFLRLFDIAQERIVAEREFPAGVSDLQIIGVGNGSHVFAVSGLHRNLDAQNVLLHLLGMDTGGGTFIGDWQTPIQLMSNGSPVPAHLQGVPAVYPPMIGPFKLENVLVAPSNRLYLAFAMSGHGANQPIYISDDFGATFREETFSGVPEPGIGLPHAFTPMRAASFSGNHYLIEGVLSSDTGQTWRRILPRHMEDGHATLKEWYNKYSISMDPSVVYLEPSVRWGLIKSNIGYQKVTAVTGEPNWFTTSGFLAITLYDLAKAFSHPNRAVISTVAGYSITSNFLAERPEWLANYCPSSDCYGGRGVAADPADPDVFYMAGNPFIYRVTLNGSSDPSAFKLEFLNKAQLVDRLLPNQELGEKLSYGTLYTNPFLLPGKLAVTLFADRDNDPLGGIFFFDLGQPFCQKPAETSRPDDSLPCGADTAKTAVIEVPGRGSRTTDLSFGEFAAVSRDVMFAATSGRGSWGSLAEARGVYRSEDGGSTFRRMNDSLLEPTWPIQAFAYDSRTDTLYAVQQEETFSAARPTRVVSLKKAAEGNQSWESSGELPADFSSPGSPPPNPAGYRLTAVAIDPITGLIAVGGQENGRAKVWFSDNGGTNWQAAGSGLKDESVNFLSFDEVVQGARVGIRSARRLVQGSSTGLYSMSGAAYTPATCTLKLSKQCKKKVRKGTNCQLTAAMGKTAATALTKVALERGNRLGGAYKQIIKPRAAGKGSKRLTLTATKNYFYRAKFSTPACVTKPVRIAVK